MFPVLRHSFSPRFLPSIQRMSSSLRWKYDPELYPDRIPENTSYLELFGLDPKKAFEVDTSLVKARFLTLQRSLHPDKFTLQPKEAQEYSGRMSSLVNEGYKTLTSPLLRALYLLRRSGVEIGEQESTDPALLMEVMELREHLDETHDLATLSNIKTENQARIRETEKVLSRHFKEENLGEAKQETIKLRYWSNMQAAIEQKIFDHK